jgi:hypothetical protein
MITTAPVSGTAAPPTAARMRSLLLSWALLAAVWNIGLLLVELLVLSHIRLTAAALWTATLVSACQAIALESLAAPLGLRPALARLRRSFRSPLVWIPWSLVAASFGAAGLGGGARAVSTGAALLSSCAAVLLFAATRPSRALHAARGATITFAFLLLLASSNHFVPVIERLPGLLALRWPAGATRMALLATAVCTAYAVLFRVQRTLGTARPKAATWLAAAAGTGALALLVRFLPLSLEVAVPGAEPVAPAALLALVSACLATAGIALTAPEPRE